MSFKDHFSSRAAIYAQARPTYPRALFERLAALAPARDLVWDSGTGNGQAAVALTEHFECVIATDPSAAQLENAAPHPRVVYRQGAELLPGQEAASVDLVTVASAVHWMDTDVFYPEVRRVLRPGGVVAIWNLRVFSVTPSSDRVISHLYHDTLRGHWPLERRHAETSYRDFSFPFDELPFPETTVERQWTMAEITDYLRTWSAVIRYHQAQGRDPIAEMEGELRAVWGDGRQTVKWPLGGRVGRAA